MFVSAIFKTLFCAKTTEQHQFVKSTMHITRFIIYMPNSGGSKGRGSPLCEKFVFDPNGTKWSTLSVESAFAELLNLDQNWKLAFH